MRGTVRLLGWRKEIVEVQLVRLRFGRWFRRLNIHAGSILMAFDRGNTKGRMVADGSRGQSWETMEITEVYCLAECRNNRGS